MAFNPDIHHRKSIRITNFDYAQPGAYFITVCTHQRAPLFGHIAHGEMHLNKVGQIVQNYWHAIPHHFPAVRLDEFIVMPNHIHGIVVINDVGAIHESPQSNASDKSPQCFMHSQRAIHESPLQNTVMRRNMTIPKLVGRFKMQAAKQINILQNTPGMPVWQRNYWERIIRDQREMQLVRQYIRNNTVNWQQDDLHDP